MIPTLFRLADVVAIGMAAYFGFLSYTVIAQGPLPMPKISIDPEKATESRPAARTATPSSGSPVLSRDLFRTAAIPIAETEKTEKVEVRVEDLEETRLQLRLWGTVTAEAGKEYAVIEDRKGREQNLYQVGDVLQDALIQKILREKVVLRVGDRDEILSMEEMVSQAGGGRPVVSPARSPDLPLPGRDTEPQPAEEAEPVRQTVTLEEDFVSEVGDKLGDMLQGVRFRPHFSGGQVDGIRVTGLRPDSPLLKLGIRNGDVITSVNGQAVNTPDAALSALGSFGDGQESQVEINRRGRPTVLEYSQP
jgi:general secretion pathway protein C